MKSLFRLAPVFGLYLQAVVLKTRVCGSAPFEYGSLCMAAFFSKLKRKSRNSSGSDSETLSPDGNRICEPSSKESLSTASKKKPTNWF